MTADAKPRVRVIKKQIEGIRLSFGSILLMLCATFMLILSTFVQVNVSHFILPSGFFSGENLLLSDFIHTYKLIPQIPVVMFIGAFLGRKYGITSILLYILLGLFVIPVFALGGGPRYIFEYSFGYILAYIPAVYLTGTILKSGFTYKNIGKAVFVGIFTIHIIGILYMLAVAGIRHEGLMFTTGWILAQSGVKIIYDFILSYLSVLVAKYARLVLWLYM